MKSVRIIAGDGVGGQIEAYQCAYHVKRAGDFVEVLSCSRDEVFRPIKYFFGDMFPIVQIKEDYQNQIISDEFLFNELKGNYDECYLCWPDLVFQHPKSFNYKKYNVSIKTIKNTKLLLEKRKPAEKLIYLGLLSNTDHYTYQYIPQLAVKLATTLPDHLIYLSVLTNWAGKKIPEIKFDFVPNNLFIHENPDFINSLEYLERSVYCISTDNGIMHCCFQYGIDRLILDPQWGNGKNVIPWQVRWRSTMEDSISIDNFPNDIVRLVKTNLEIPQTTILSKNFVLNNLNSNWASELLFKF